MCFTWYLTYAQGLPLYVAVDGGVDDSDRNEMRHEEDDGKHASPLRPQLKSCRKTRPVRPNERDRPEQQRQR